MPGIRKRKSNNAYRGLADYFKSVAYRLHFSSTRKESCKFQMNKLFVATLLICMILLASAVFVHISTDLMVSDAIIMRARHSVCWRDRSAFGEADFSGRPVGCPFLYKRVGK